MQFITDSIIEDAKAHALEVFPKESCGFVAGGKYLPQQNLSQEEDAFRLGRDTWLLAEERHGRIQAVIHSHPYLDGRLPAPDYPSAADMRGQLATGVPWGITVAAAEGAFPDIIWFGDACPVPPLTGPERYFRHGVTDCYSLIRDYYRLELGISLLEFPRDWEWWLEGKDLYSAGFSQTGFRAIPAALAKTGDVFLAAVGSSARHKMVANHGGIYLGGREHRILHHLSGRMPVDVGRVAKEEPGERWMRFVTTFIRHEKMENR